jgi:S1-C subfamily serine protease
MAHALTPDRIFERVAPSVWSVKAYGTEEKLLASASGVAIAPDKLVTNCRVLVRARQVQVHRGNLIYDAKLEFPDIKRNLCQLIVPGMSAPVPAQVSARALRPGLRIYVVGFSLGNEQSIGEGLVSAVHDAGGPNERIQTTVPTTPGLLGAGVFDDEGRLVGVVTSSPKESAATAFAVPVDWLAAVAARGQAVLAARSNAAARTAGSLPAAGTTWVYGFVERLFTGRQTDFTVDVLRVNDHFVDETMSVDTQAVQRIPRTVDARELRFIEQSLGAGAVLLEMAPYLLAASGGKAPADFATAVGYPLGGLGLPNWAISVRHQSWEQVTVPAGTFRALRIDVTGQRERPVFTSEPITGHFKMSVWYAAEVQRFIKLRHQMWHGPASRPNRQLSDDSVELLSFRPAP